ncbi:organic cation transporter protein-like [Argopecten irradians]|uniref:organic cation transporter protein-like n=1 Tax=Argopecten irradians TaxID=31199 RepID=UPI0037114348
MMDVDVDNLQRELKSWGRYQSLQLVYLFVSYLPVAIPLFIVIFIGYVPPHKCAELSKPLHEYGLGIPAGNTSDFTINYDQCELTISSNHSNSSWAPVTTSCIEGYSYETTKEYSFASEWDLVCDKQGLGGLTTTLIMVGQALGATIFTTLSDRYGRKTIFMCTFIPLTAILTGTSFAPNLLVFNILRILTGFIQQGLGLSMYAMCIEMFPLESRGAIAAIGGLYWAIAVVFFAGYAFVLRNFSWRTVQLACAALAFHCVFAYWITDESLRWLVANNKRKQVIRIVKKIAKINKIDPHKALCMIDGGGMSLSPSFQKKRPLLQTEKEIGPDEKIPTGKDQEMELTISKQRSDAENETEQTLFQKIPEFGNGNVPLLSQQETEIVNGHAQTALPVSRKADENRPEKYTILDIFKHKLLLRNSLITWYTWFINSLTYYGLYLSSVTLSTDRYLNFLINGALEIPAGVSVWLLINRIGRKKSSIIFHTLAGVALILSVVMKLPKDEAGIANIFSIIFNFVGKFAITASWNTMGLYTPEIYPTNLRNAGLGTASAAARFGGMLSPYADVLARRAFWAPGIIFGVGSLLVNVGMMMYRRQMVGSYLRPLRSCSIGTKERKISNLGQIIWRMATMLRKIEPELRKVKTALGVISSKWCRIQHLIG